jgi:hypothetical protein
MVGIILMQSTLRKQKIYVPLYTYAIPRGILKLSAYLILVQADVILLMSRLSAEPSLLALFWIFEAGRRKGFSEDFGGDRIYQPLHNSGIFG